MRELTQTEAIDLVGRYEAGQEIPERMRGTCGCSGPLLGRVLRESGSPGLYDDVERLRAATIQAYTDETPEAFARAAAIADSFTVERAEEVARAFTVYFHLMNLIEEHQRVRVLRERDGRPEKEDAVDSVAAAFVKLAAEVGDDTALAAPAGAPIPSRLHRTPHRGSAECCVAQHSATDEPARRARHARSETAPTSAASSAAWSRRSTRCGGGRDRHLRYAPDAAIEAFRVPLPCGNGRHRLRVADHLVQLLWRR